MERAELCIEFAAFSSLMEIMFCQALFEDIVLLGQIYWLQCKLSLSTDPLFVLEFAG